MQHNETAHLQSEFDIVHTEQSTEIGFVSLTDCFSEFSPNPM
jgi:hypothetical protein